jgi:hypothetical protein
MLDFRPAIIVFPQVAATPAQTLTTSVQFNGTVRTAQVALKGFDIRFGNGEHPIEGMIVTAGSFPVSINNPTGSVVVSATVSMFDSSRGNNGLFDDPYGGEVFLLVIADVV